MKCTLSKKEVLYIERKFGFDNLFCFISDQDELASEEKMLTKRIIEKRFDKIILSPPYLFLFNAWNSMRYYIYVLDPEGNKKYILYNSDHIICYSEEEDNITLVLKYYSFETLKKILEKKLIITNASFENESVYKKISLDDHKKMCDDYNLKQLDEWANQLNLEKEILIKYFSILTDETQECYLLTVGDSLLIHECLLIIVEKDNCYYAVNYITREDKEEVEMLIGNFDFIAKAINIF